MLGHSEELEFKACCFWSALSASKNVIPNENETWIFILCVLHSLFDIEEGA